MLVRGTILLIEGFGTADGEKSVTVVIVAELASADTELCDIATVMLAAMTAALNVDRSRRTQFSCG